MPFQQFIYSAISTGIYLLYKIPRLSHRVADGAYRYTLAITDIPDQRNQLNAPIFTNLNHIQLMDLKIHFVKDFFIYFQKDFFIPSSGYEYKI